MSEGTDLKELAIKLACHIPDDVVFYIAVMKKEQRGIAAEVAHSPELDSETVRAFISTANVEQCVDMKKADE